MEKGSHERCAARREEAFRRITQAVGAISCNVRPDNGHVTIEWYDFGNVYGCYRSAEGATLSDALQAALAEIEASRTQT